LDVLLGIHPFVPARTPQATAAVREKSHLLFLTEHHIDICRSYVQATIISAMASPQTFTISRSDLKGPNSSVTLITGGAAGIGLQTALVLHSISPTNKVILLDRQPPNKEQAPKDFLDSDRVLALQCDITDWRSQREAFETGFQRFGAIDNVFVNAGIAEYKDQFFKDDLDDEGKLQEPDRRVYDVDLSAANDTLKLAIHYMRKKRSSGSQGGNVVMTASLAGYLASAGAPLYSAAKHGSLLPMLNHDYLFVLLLPFSLNIKHLEISMLAITFSLVLVVPAPSCVANSMPLLTGIVGLMRALKNDTATLNISVSVVAPGITLTDIVSGRGAGESLSDWAKRMRGLGVPINDPGEVATAVVWLMSLGMGANGKGMLVQAGKVADVEEGIAKNRKVWMGAEMLELFRGGRSAPLFPNKL
jgi:NAD(P)-dependent dehydrogenase (short-subunit alcohol dehydrogenase family)